MSNENSAKLSGRLLKFIFRGPAAFVRRSRSKFNTIYAILSFKSVGKRCSVGAGFYTSHPWLITFSDEVSVQEYVTFSSEFSDGVAKIGHGVQINSNVKVDHSGGISIGNNTLISEGVVIYTHDHGLDPRSRPTKIPKHVGDDCWIGAGAYILHGCANIGRGSIIASCAVVTKDVPEYTVVAGNPARVIKNLR